MRISQITISNFRGIKSATILLPPHALLIGDNNTGKTTILEAIDLVLGPDRLNRFPPIVEHDFFQGKYVATSNATSAPAHAPRIEIEATIVGLSDEQKSRFGDYIEFWDASTNAIYKQPNPEGIDAANIIEALRVTFVGAYDSEEDDFEGKTYFSRSLSEGNEGVGFSKKDKQICGFLYLRSLRTGSRALSLERGSLLDIILRLKEVRPKMWEDTISQLDKLQVAANPELGISDILESINTALKKYVPKEWGIEPHLKVSSLTREHLRQVITAFIATGEGTHAAPFYRQGTGTINMLVLAMLSQIAEDKQNVIFAMEEPETAIAPYAQKRIVHEVRKLASQAIFTSHSPYVLEEFSLDETVVLSRDSAGQVQQSTIILPDSIKLKRYRQEFRTRFCEGLLARRVLIAEGAAEWAAFPVACRRLAELNAATYSSLEALGICTINADGSGNIPSLAKLFRELGKQTFAICDKLPDDLKTQAEAQVKTLLMHDESGLENLILKHTTESALKRYATALEWPAHLKHKFPHPSSQAKDALKAYFEWSKGTGGVSEFLAQCTEAEIPAWLRDACKALREACETTPAAA